MSEKPIVEPLRLGRGKKPKKRPKSVVENQINRFKELEGQFRTLGKIIGREETFKAKLNSAICYGLAEVCELLAEVTKEEPSEG